MREIRFETEGGVLVYRVPDSTTLSEYDAEADAEAASIAAGTYPPEFIPAKEDAK